MRMLVDSLFTSLWGILLTLLWGVLLTLLWGVRSIFQRHSPHCLDVLAANAVNWNRCRSNRWDCVQPTCATVPPVSLPLRSTAPSSFTDARLFPPKLAPYSFLLLFSWFTSTNQPPPSIFFKKFPIEKIPLLSSTLSHSILDLIIVTFGFKRLHIDFICPCCLCTWNNWFINSKILSAYLSSCTLIVDVKKRYQQQVNSEFMHYETGNCAEDAVFFGVLHLILMSTLGKLKRFHSQRASHYADCYRKCHCIWEVKQDPKHSLVGTNWVGSEA